MEKKLSKDAYGNVAGKDYVPYVTDGNRQGGNTFVLFIGILLAAIFAASTTYSGLKAGLTVAAGIPGAIIGGAIVSRKSGILGTNLVQGMSSGGESVASGIIFVLPAVLIIGGQISVLEGLAVGFAGILIGIAVATLVYNYLIVEEHGKLMYQESMAISETLVAQNTGGEALKYMSIGGVIGGLISFVTSAFMGFFNNTIAFVGDKTYSWQFKLEANPLLLGIGFIVGLEIALTMFAGTLLANFAVTPLISYFGSMTSDSVHTWNTIGTDAPVALNSLEAAQISSIYTRYIGAGMMLCGGIIGAVKLIPVIITSVKSTLAARTSTEAGSKLGMVILLLAIILSFVSGFIISNGNVSMAILATFISIILMFLFVIVAGRLTGTIGTSNLPVSGMTIASLVILTLIFVLMGWVSKEDNKILLMFGTLIVTAIAMAGGYMQSQKVTFIVGGKKDEMQKYYLIAGAVGVLAVIGTITFLGNELLAKTPSGDSVFAMPQAGLMATLTQGIMQGNLPWAMIIAGVFIALTLYFLDLPIMTVAIGFYLPIATVTIILVGALIKVLVENVVKDEKEKEARVSNGISLSSGLVAGGSLVGLIGIVFQVTKIVSQPELTGFAAGNGAATMLFVILVVFVTIPILFGRVSKK